jgi:SAM-dependent methyltransferase
METSEYHTMFAVEGSHWWYLALHRLIRTALDTHVPNWRQASILDAGCGTGAILQRLGSSSRAAGVDFSSEAVTFCRQRGLRNVAQGDVGALPFVDASFDAVICSNVLYHKWVDGVGGALTELRRVLRPGGVLLVVLPAYEFLRSDHDRAVMTARRFTKEEVRELLVARGLTIRHLTYWTTLFFPAALVARTLGGSRRGHDFDSTHPSRFRDSLLAAVMSLELLLLRWIPLPFGVSLFAVAQKPLMP